ncbi:hypothetical protein P154DRAFT_478820 [Amniculicola lignicola CBS 123094]|uniref:Osmotin, thaumatin-like protein n=1 Tax=Amniculicola lignicola CBS 123094 TaxID=1392246 RepID=A0A6A5X419_9PLEO|nr:hypothetical protein P154DRAFT_478820 [Amniculicola lignicola CBS 123094]
MPFGNVFRLLVLFASLFATTKSEEALPDGKRYGSVKIRNNCDYPLYVWSVGVHKLGGNRELPKAGLHTDADDQENMISPKGNWSEAYRTTCYKENATHQYCPGSDLGAGQGVSLKISKEKTPSSNITQFEYTLTKNTHRKDQFFRFDYDISLLDCGKNTTMVTDACAGNTASDPDLKKKIEECPGFRDGLALTFEPTIADSNSSTNCPPLYCSGDEKCQIIYMWDPTRPGEPSMACEREFNGEMVLDLCVKKADGDRASKASAAYSQWSVKSMASYGIPDCSTGPKTRATPTALSPATDNAGTPSKNPPSASPTSSYLYANSTSMLMASQVTGFTTTEITVDIPSTKTT